MFFKKQRNETEHVFLKIKLLGYAFYTLSGPIWRMKNVKHHKLKLIISLLIGYKKKTKQSPSQSPLGDVTTGNVSKTSFMFYFRKQVQIFKNKN